MKQQTMTAAEYQNHLSKPKAMTRSEKTRRLFLFQIAGRRLPTPRNKDHDEGELRFAANEVDLPRQKAMKTRRAPGWSFDFAWPDQRIAVEVEGIVVTRDAATGHTRIGGRHGNVAGFNDDNEKYAWAVVLGWRVLRFTPKQVGNGFAIDMLTRLFATADDPVRVEVVRGVWLGDVPPPVRPPPSRCGGSGRVHVVVADYPLATDVCPGCPDCAPRITDELKFGNAHTPPPF